ncbi:hypothetical protein SALBM135S_00289 [Streptomyces alboniger]
MSPRNWRVPTRLNAILLIPVLVGLVMGGFQVNDTWSEAQDAESTARLVRASLDYGNRLIEERDLTAAPLLSGKKNDPVVVKARKATDEAAAAFKKASESMPDKEGLNRRLEGFRKVEPHLAPLRRNAYTTKLSGVKTEEGYVAIQHPLMEFANELGLYCKHHQLRPHRLRDLALQGRALAAAVHRHAPAGQARPRHRLADPPAHLPRLVRLSSASPSRSTPAAAPPRTSPSWRR